MLSFWVRIDLDPALAENASPANVKQVCDEIDQILGVDEVHPVERTIGRVFDSYIGEDKC
jgi:hypothetical protein